MALGIAFLMVQSLILKFWIQDVYMETNTEITAENKFPAVTICQKPFTEVDIFCNLKAYEMVPVYIAPSCHKYGYWKERKNPFVLRPIMQFDVGINYAAVESHIDMKFTCPDRGSCNNDYLTEKHFAYSKTDDIQCLTWNYKGSFFNQNNVIDLGMERYKGGLFYVYVHGYEENPIHISRPIYVSPQMNTEIILEKKITHRMKRDSPNDCETQLHNNSKIIFPGKYTREGCMDSYKCMKLLEKCGDVLDMCLNYVPEDRLEKYWKNTSIYEKYSCFREAYDSKEVDATIDQCPNSCERTRFKISTSNYMSDISSQGFVLSFLYKDKNVFDKEQEKRCTHGRISSQVLVE